jgi:hypothetical protein
MDIFDQVNEILERAEFQKAPIQVDERELASIILRDLVRRYRQLMSDRQWEPANECLLAISRMMVVLLAE